MLGEAGAELPDRDPGLHAHEPGVAVDVEHARHALERQQAPVGERDVAEGVPGADDAHALPARRGALQRARRSRRSTRDARSRPAGSADRRPSCATRGARRGAHVRAGVRAGRGGGHLPPRSLGSLTHDRAYLHGAHLACARARGSSVRGSSRLLHASLAHALAADPRGQARDGDRRRLVRDGAGGGARARRPAHDAAGAHGRAGGAARVRAREPQVPAGRRAARRNCASSRRRPAWRAPTTCSWRCPRRASTA